MAALHGALPRGAARSWWDELMRRAVDAGAPEVQAAAGVLAGAFGRDGLRVLPLAGLDASATRRLMARWFPGADEALGLDWQALAHARRAGPRDDEIDDLVDLLLGSLDPRHRPEEATWVAHVLAQACLGSDHLWQDLHLPSRRELSQLMERAFPAVAARNDRDMKWKKFLYKQLCEKAQVSVCRAPSCSVCSDHAACFGPEDAAAGG